MIPIYQPYLPKKTLKYAHSALNSSWISNLGEYKDLSKKLLKEEFNTNIILTNNGTTATHLIYKALKIKKPNLKNILVPSNVYVAAWNSLLFDGDNINLIPVKTDLITWNIDLEDLKDLAVRLDPDETAILIVHNLGGIINVPKLKRELPNYEIVEDNCEGLFGKYEDDYSGTKSLASSISFYGNKSLTCGEGGAVMFKHEGIASILEKIHSQGQSEIRYIHDIIGYNYRMTNIQAAILYGQLKYKEEILNKKQNIFNRYKKNLKKESRIIFQHESQNCKNANWMFALRIKDNNSFIEAKHFFDNANIETRNMFYPMSHHKHLQKFANKNKEQECETLLKEIIIFPSSPLLKQKEVDYICDNIIKYCRK
jgi:perosamine synthetase